ncbi:hypothetical protein W97_04363 [Coniosporium apollinis CBS 100218]|uniref:DUF5648 domain-containing protein n=1 Tax=Coniosporium apollinis (strain CBS 100218) TaxID=1168221 RepID=R7YTZ9_CONA1|nr:uncharacterized protein W97_04363 [Coniosporium apollinis CBS 100218]EON65126.1 hypothetical protein W97_04363 [Coniosporium apollinis CBS 100218]
MSGDHFYCLDFRGEIAPANGYEREGITGYVYAAQQPGTVPIFRCYNPANGDHFCTADPSGELAPRSYTYERIGWYIFKDRNTQLANPPHKSGYRSEGITWYLHPTASPATVPLYGWYNSGLFKNFTFTGIDPTQKSTLFERHSWAYHRAGICGNLSQAEKDRVRQAYRKPIAHSVSTDPNADASAHVNGQSIAGNFTNLFLLGDDEIAQMLLHEMMHCAGYTQPEAN